MDIDRRGFRTTERPGAPDRSPHRLRQPSHQLLAVAIGVAGALSLARPLSAQAAPDPNPPAPAAVAPTEFTWTETSDELLAKLQARFVDPNTPITAASARDLVRARQRLVELGATDHTLHSVAMWAAESLRQCGLQAEARAELEFVLARPTMDEAYKNSARIELAYTLFPRQELARIDELLAQSEAVTEVAAVGRVLASSSDTPDQELAEKELGACIDALRWFSARTLLELQMGRPDRAEEFLVQQERLAQSLAGPNEIWEAIDNRLRLWLALNDNDEVLRYLDSPRTVERLAMLLQALPEVAHSIEQRRMTAEYERLNRSGGDLSAALEKLLGLMRNAAIDHQNRAEAARRVAHIGCEIRRPELTREALSFLQDTSARIEANPTEDPTGQAVFDALALAATLDEQSDANTLAEAITRLEASFVPFADHWQRVSLRRMGLSYLRSGDRYVVPSELLRACIANEGVEIGGHRALRAIYRLQRVGGLANTLLGEHAPLDLDLDLGELCANGAGVMIFQPGLATSHVVLVETSGIDVEEIAPAWRVMEVCTALANVCASAIHGDQSLSNPAVDAELASLSNLALGERTREHLERWTAVTLIGDEVFGGHIPLALLRGQDGQRFGDRLPISYAPSLPIAAELSRRARGKGPRANEEVRTLVLGVPASPQTGKLAGGIRPLSIPTSRFDAWSDELSGSVELRLGTDATASGLHRDHDEFDLVQVVAHGTRDPRRECPNGFVLYSPIATECVVWGEDVEAGTAARVTSLAVCGAARRTSVRGDDGRTGLAASFVIAGSDCVLQTTTDLEATSAIDFFERVCSWMTHGASPAAALAQTRRERTETGTAELQDYLVYAWGAGLVPIAASTSPPSPTRAHEQQPLRWNARTMALLAVGGALIVGWRLRGRIRT